VKSGRLTAQMASRDFVQIAKPISVTLFSKSAYYLSERQSIEINSLTTKGPSRFKMSAPLRRQKEKPHVTKRVEILVCAPGQDLTP
jgi:hypothetical protein